MSIFPACGKIISVDENLSFDAVKRCNGGMVPVRVSQIGGFDIIWRCTMCGREMSRYSQPIK